MTNLKRNIYIFALALFSFSNSLASAYFKEAQKVNPKDFEAALANMFPQRISVADDSDPDCADFGW